MTLNRHQGEGRQGLGIKHGNSAVLPVSSSSSSLLPSAISPVPQPLLLSPHSFHSHASVLSPWFLIVLSHPNKFPLALPQMQPLLAGWGSQLQQGCTQSKQVPVPQTRAAEGPALLALLLLVLPNPGLFISDLFNRTELCTNELHGEFSSLEVRGLVWGRGCPLP